MKIYANGISIKILFLYIGSLPITETGFRVWMQTRTRSFGHIV